MKRRTYSGIPPELVEPLGNLIRKTAYTQLKAVRIVGIGISGEDGKMCLPTSTIGSTSTTTLLDIICQIADCPLKASSVKDWGHMAKNNDSPWYDVEVSFQNLKEALSQFLLVDNLKDDLLITNGNPHRLKLRVMEIERDMCSSSLQAYMSDGMFPIPCSVLPKFQLDYSKKENGELSYTVSDEFDEQLCRVLKELQSTITPQE